MKISDPKPTQNMPSAALDAERKELTRKNIIATVVSLLGFFVVISVIGFVFEPQLRTFGEYFADKYGILGLSVLMFLGDFLVSPIPPELSLFIVFNSSMNENWPMYVGILAFASWFAGQCGWLGGKYMARQKWVPKWVRMLPHKHKTKLRKFGSLIVLLGAVSPLPFSLTCWAAGFVRLNYWLFVTATLARFPRVFLGYWLISSSDTFRSLF